MVRGHGYKIGANNSEGFNVTDEVNRGCVLAPTLFSTMCAAMLADAFKEVMWESKSAIGLTSALQPFLPSAHFLNFLEVNFSYCPLRVLWWYPEVMSRGHHILCSFLQTCACMRTAMYC